MYQVRIPDLLSSSTLSNSVSVNKAEYLNKMEQISSGKKYLSRSDDPVATNEAQTINNDLTVNDQWGQNITMCTTWEGTTDSAIQSVTTAIQRINELTVEANSGTLSADDKKTIGTEVNQLLESLVQYGNTKCDGINIFSGTATCFTHDPLGGPTTAVSSDAFTVKRNAAGDISEVYFLGRDESADPLDYSDVTPRSMQIDQNASINYGVLGMGDTPSLYTYNYNYTYTDTSGNTQTENVDVNLFSELVKFRDIMNGTDTTTSIADTTKIISNIQAAVDNITNCGVQVTSSESRLINASSNLTNVKSALTNRLDSVADIDEASAITDLYNVQTALTSSLQMVTKMNEMSLVNFI